MVMAPMAMVGAGHRIEPLRDGAGSVPLPGSNCRDGWSFNTRPAGRTAAGLPPSALFGEEVMDRYRVATDISDPRRIPGLPDFERQPAFVRQAGGAGMTSAAFDTLPPREHVPADPGAVASVRMASPFSHQHARLGGTNASSAFVIPPIAEASTPGSRDRSPRWRHGKRPRSAHGGGSGVGGITNAWTRPHPGRRVGIQP